MHVEEHGNPDGQPILFIHGFNQCRLCWNRQVHSSLADNHRLITMDIRGHGLSEKLHDVYGTSKLWADDIAAIITELELEKPVLSGWSYGGSIICDYLQYFGEDNIGGIHFVGAISKIGAPAMEFLGKEYVAVAPGYLSENYEENSQSLQRFVRLCVATELSPEDYYFMLGYNFIVPPHVRNGLRARTIDYDTLLSKIAIPALLTHGKEDVIVLPSMAEHHKKLMPHATLSLYENVGHSPFWEDAKRFNADLAAFVNLLIR